MGKKLSRWFWCNFVFALTPLGLMVLIRYLGSKLSFHDMTSSPEILFFSLILCATSLGDALEYKTPKHRETLFTNITYALMFMGGVSAVLYGCLIFNTMFDLKQEGFQTRLFILSIPLALACLTTSGFTQHMIGKIEESA